MWLTLYDRHPYILSKRSNIVQISLSPNIFLSYNVSHTFPHFSQMLEKLTFSLTTMHFQCQNSLILSHLSETFDVPAGCVQGGMYPSMQWDRGCVSQHAMGQGCLPGGFCLVGVCLGGVYHTPSSPLGTP